MKPWILASIAVALLAGCATKEAPVRTVFQEVRVPVTAYCVKQADIPDEPPLIGSQLTGNAAQDIGPVAIAAIELRKRLKIARALLIACVEPGR